MKNNKTFQYALEKAAKYICTSNCGLCPAIVEKYPCPENCDMETNPWQCWINFFSQQHKSGKQESLETSEQVVNVSDNTRQEVTL
jgi:hypothetical protein